MISTTHLLIGGAIGALSSNEGAAFVGGVVSHFIADSIPHFDPGTKYGPGNVKEGESPNLIDYLLASLDLILGLFLLYFLARNQPAFLRIGFGGLGAILVDLIDNVPFWKERLKGKFFFAELNYFHQRFHHNLFSRAWKKGVLVQAAISVVAAVIILLK